MDVPFWYGTVAVGGATLADKLLARADAVTAMTYRNTVSGVNSLTAVGRDLLGRTALAGRPVRLAVETGPLADCPHCTFHGAGRPALDEALARVDDLLAGHPAHAGMAVHHYDAWRALPAG